MKSSTQSLVTAGSLLITLNIISNSVQVQAALNNKKTDNIELMSKGDLINRGHDLYMRLETRIITKAKWQRLINELSHLLIYPFQSFINLATEIIFVMHKELLEIPIDLLSHKRRPLFLQLPVSFMINQPVGMGFVPLHKTSVLALSDKSADPERACKMVSDSFANTFTYIDASKIGPAFMRKQTTVDILLLSAHGVIGKSNEDYIKLGKGSANANDFSNIRPRLAYFDSCRLGISRQFLNTFKEIGTSYFIAPILSNEAGNSSTKTMITFFEHLYKGKPPEVALFYTRKQLWNTFLNDEYRYRVWRAYPFRLYRLN